MGGKGSGRLNATDRILKNARNEKTTVAKINGNNGDFIIPNHSGDMSAGDVLTTPINDNDLVNKKYVDDNVVVPAGLDTHVQFNDGGSFGGDTGFKFNSSTNALSVHGNINGEQTQQTI